MIFDLFEIIEFSLQSKSGFGKLRQNIHVVYFTNF